MLVVSASWTLLSQNFVYGEGHAERPILVYLVLFFVGWAAFLIGLLAVAVKQEKPSLKMILLVAVAARLILLPSGLIQENDVYRYVLDGQVSLHGENPFAYSPLVLPELGSEDLRRSLETIEAQQVLHKVGYPEVSTIYPPLAQLAFAVGAKVYGWDWMGQRVVFLIADLLVMFVLLLILRRLSLSPCWLLIYAWNPLVLKEIANSAHLDVLVALTLGLLILALLRYEERPTLARLSVAAIFLGMSILSKLYPVLLMPACLMLLIRSGSSVRRLAQFVVITAGIVVLGYLPFMSVDIARLTAGLSAYAHQWRMNDGIFSLLGLVFETPRVVVAALIGILALVIPIARGSRSTREVVGDFQWILLFWYLFIPTPFPWYAVPLVALAVASPTGRPAIVTVVLSGATGLYYLSFFYEYHEFAGSWWNWTRAVEHSLIWLALFATLVFRPGSTAPPQAIKDRGPA